ncbi:MAG: NAD+ synthase [Rhodobacterales bacterium]|nr:MAG: NAD+ synthase [Rhodobacterales bacterium]
MSETFRLTLAQLNPTVGDIDGNAAKARDAWEKARAAGAVLVAFPESFLTGAETGDLVRRPAFWSEAMAAVERLAADCADGPALAIGGPWHDGERLCNAWFFCEGGRLRTRVLKQRLPDEEARLFAPGGEQAPFALAGLRIGAPVGEDALADGDICTALAGAGAGLLLVPDATPYGRGQRPARLEQMRARVAETGLPLICLKMTGGQDEQVFDGGSFGINPDGELAFMLPQFDDAVAHVDLERHGDAGWRIRPGEVAPPLDDQEADYRAMVTGVGEYFAKTGFGKAVLGLSGGVDSAIVAAIATDALGPENLRCVMLPSEYTSQASLADAEKVAHNLGTRLDTLPIAGPRAAVTEVLAPLFKGRAPDVTEENIQSRLRGLLLMALSNKFGEMLLTTGNKSEGAVGYATIYGDMAGGYNPIKDLYKTRVFEICRWRNAHHRPWMKGPAGEVIPASVIDKPPSAELRDGQKDEDSLPPYDVLDAVLEGLIDREASVAELVAEGFDRRLVKRVEHLIFISEYKRFQAAPGVRLTPRSFGADRRYPVVNRWRDKS